MGIVRVVMEFIKSYEKKVTNSHDGPGIRQKLRVFLFTGVLKTYTNL
jgi:hypothetical protein